MDVREAIRKIVGSDKPSAALGVVAKVVEVTGTTCKVSPIDDSADIEGVRLQSGAGNGLLIIPKVDSVVIVHMLNDVEGYISMFSEIDSIQMLDGTFDGLVKVAELTEKLNNLENKVNDIITKYNTHVHTGVTTGAGSSGTTPTTVSGSLTQTTQEELENPKVTHGDV